MNNSKFQKMTKNKICLKFDQFQAEARITPDEILDRIVNETIKKYDMDESHGLQHARDVSHFASLLIPNDLSEEDVRLVHICAYVHDLVDSKYQAQDNIDRVLDFLATKYCCSDQECSIIEFVISNISFSKRRVNLAENKPEFGTTDPHLIQLCSLVADADMLDAYDPRRAEMYQEHRFQEMEESEKKRFLIRSWTRTIMEKRVLKYLDQWLRSPFSKDLATSYHKYLLAYCQDHYTDDNSELLDY